MSKIKQLRMTATRRSYLQNLPDVLYLDNRPIMKENNWFVLSIIKHSNAKTFNKQLLAVPMRPEEGHILD